MVERVHVHPARFAQVLSNLLVKRQLAERLTELDARLVEFGSQEGRREPEGTPHC